MCVLSVVMLPCWTWTCEIGILKYAVLGRTPSEVSFSAGFCKHDGRKTDTVALKLDPHQILEVGRVLRGSICDM